MFVFLKNPCFFNLNSYLCGEKMKIAGNIIYFVGESWRRIPMVSPFSLFPGEGAGGGVPFSAHSPRTASCSLAHAGFGTGCFSPDSCFFPINDDVLLTLDMACLCLIGFFSELLNPLLFSVLCFVLIFFFPTYAINIPTGKISFSGRFSDSLNNFLCFSDTCNKSIILL